ncbi:hypothetical protein [Natrinema gelatinilyticum]|uniref:hypothetical protein n=1 Tax=Natrinema gelatinilyticum TaxID=2961571 RepID=UPI0020C5991B|nr:hypothetical protein [Natrinema gelatinilyticum]
MTYSSPYQIIRSASNPSRPRTPGPPRTPGIDEFVGAAGGERAMGAAGAMEATPPATGGVLAESGGSTMVWPAGNDKHRKI